MYFLHQNCLYNILFIHFKFCPEGTTTVMTFCLPAGVCIGNICIIAGTLSMFSARGCVPVSSLGSVRGNTVPRDSIDPYTSGGRDVIGYYDHC